MRNCFVLAACLLFALSAFAANPGKDRHVTLDVQPRSAPSPALKYQLLPELAEMQPGNCIPAYLKCFCEQNNFFYNKDIVAERERLVKCLLSDIKPGELKGYGGSATRQADIAARHEICDWNLLPQIRSDGYMLLLPDLQQLRMLAYALVVRGRGEIVDGDHDGAIRTLKTLFALARHTSEHPTLIGTLVGAAIAQHGCDLLEEFVQSPNSPNLYWALATFPTPPLDVRRSLSGERMIWETCFVTLVDHKRVWTPEDVQEGIKKSQEISQSADLTADRRKEAGRWLASRVTDEAWLTAARQFLIDSGYSEDKVRQYPPHQVVFFKMHSKLRTHRDESLKWMSLPYWQAEDGLREVSKVPHEMEDIICHSLGFGVERVRVAHVRFEQRLALLRLVEAVRLQAAANDGKLPATRDDISAPIPADPATGKSFAYQVDGTTASIEGRPLKMGMDTFHYRYEIRLRK